VKADQEAQFEALARQIEGRSGLDVGAYKDRLLRRRIATRMRAWGVHSYGDYLQVLAERPEEFDRLLDALTINVTKFFRNPETWNCLADRILPELLAVNEGRLRAWSAGCASGEEAYTLVMLAALTLERMGHPEWLDRVRVDATDIDRASLDRTRLGNYDRVAFSEADPAMVDRFCRPVGAQRVEVLDELRALVSTRRLDLTSEAAPANDYDLICCRNVVIYFDRATQERLMHDFADALRPRGILVLGKVETIFGPARPRFELVETRERIYRKVA
jgi:chemotaxis methyl-accepting protein methylase